MRKLTTLPTLAAEINKSHQQAENYAKSAIEHALACGDALLKAKKQVKHGEWLPWLQTNTTVSERTARNYMRVAGNRKQLESKTADVADLTVSGALELLSKPKITFMDKVYESIDQRHALLAEINEVRALLDCAESLTELKAVFDKSMDLNIRVAGHHHRVFRNLGEEFNKGSTLTDVLECDVAALSAIGLDKDMTFKKWITTPQEVSQ